eukprot:TRINITY_DN251_c1_g1_i2.p2 TRINITY_DN251_c1_g1~~TRINITY_DN251_c1_g1_i2.p2  ORF type:complete len:197 (-),score=-20.59 TRINITY_DN251_c1_g1_i2:469-1059(-)
MLTIYTCQPQKYTLSTHKIYTIHKCQISKPQIKLIPYDVKCVTDNVRKPYGKYIIWTCLLRYEYNDTTYQNENTVNLQNTQINVPKLISVQTQQVQIVNYNQSHYKQNERINHNSIVDRTKKTFCQLIKSQFVSYYTKCNQSQLYPKQSTRPKCKSDITPPHIIKIPQKYKKQYYKKYYHPTQGPQTQYTRTSLDL